MYPRGQGNCPAAAGKGLLLSGTMAAAERAGRVRVRGGQVRCTPQTGISATSPCSPQAMLICAALPPLKSRVSGCKRKSSTLALSNNKCLSLAGSISPQGTEAPLHFTSVCYLGGYSCLWCSRLGIMPGVQASLLWARVVVGGNPKSHPPISPPIPHSTHPPQPSTPNTLPRQPSSPLHP